MAIGRLRRVLLAAALLAGACGENGGNGGGAGGASGCLGADDALVGACVFDDGSCSEYRGGLGTEEARVDCSDPGFAGTFQEDAACPPATQASGGCVEPFGGGSRVNYDASISAPDFEQLCEQFGACYFDR